MRCTRDAAPLVQTAKALIAANLDRNIAVRHLCRTMNCSPWFLCRAFRRVTGQTITGYRHALRLRVAIERLRDQCPDLTDLALELGFSSHSHFTAVFRKHLGATPSEVRAGRK